MNVVITRAETEADIKVVAALAQEIWTQHFTPIIGAAQVDYMLTQFQSAGAIASQIAADWEYYLLRSDGEWSGYTGLIPDRENNRMMISKIYLRNQDRGKGLGKAILEFIEDRSIRDGYTTLWLTVNRHNNGPIAWYKHRGFKIVDEVKKDIGNGFCMDDFIMEKRILPFPDLRPQPF